MQRFFSLYIIMRLKEKMEKPLLERYKSTRDLNESPIVRTNSVSSTTDETPLQTNNESVFCVNNTYITQKTTFNTLFYDHTSCSLEKGNSLMFPSSLTTVHIHISSPTSSPTPSPIHSLTSSPKHAAALPTTIPVPVHVPVPVPVPVPTSKSRSSCLIA